MGNEKALGNFIGLMGEARERIAELQEYIDNHMNTSPDEINWGNCGSAEYLLAQLTELTDWAYNRGEYA
ncbi:MAG: hypothetical protein FWE27_02665 [Defluviitaleaceae bacterium]|nr:hypothetical protein [Defluviitaleaceae bacterium]